MLTKVLAIFLGASALAYGQIDVTIGSTNDGSTTILYKNMAPARLTAFVAAWIVTQSSSDHGVPSITFRDGFIEDNLEALPSGAQQSLHVGGKGITVSQAQILAAVFEDGSSYGDPAWVRLIQTRRGHYLDALNAGLSDLKAAADANASMDTLTQQLTASQTSQLAVTKKSPVEGSAIRQLLSESTPTVKAANLQVVANDTWRGCIHAVYGTLIRSVGKASSGASSAATIANLTDRLSVKKSNLLAAKPAPLL